MRVCVIGGRGFVGSAVTERLQEREHDVTTMDPAVGGADHISLSILDHALRRHLNGFDVVVNLVGLSPLKQPRGTTYADLHVGGATNVVTACEENDVERLVHMSALGADPHARTTFLRTKGKGEEIVLNADLSLDATVIRPSIIFDHGNELVELAKRSSWMRVFPDIRARVQPIYRGDVASLFEQAVHGRIADPIIEAGGPEKMTLFQFVKTIYNAQGRACHPLPVVPLMVFGLRMMEHVPFLPWGADQAHLLKRDNTTDENVAAERLELTSVPEWIA